MVRDGSEHSEHSEGRRKVAIFRGLARVLWGKVSFRLYAAIEAFSLKLAATRGGEGVLVDAEAGTHGGADGVGAGSVLSQDGEYLGDICVFVVAPEAASAGGMTVGEHGFVVEDAKHGGIVSIGDISTELRAVALIGGARVEVADEVADVPLELADVVEASVDAVSSLLLEVMACVLQCLAPQLRLEDVEYGATHLREGFLRVSAMMRSHGLDDVLEEEDVLDFGDVWHQNLSAT